MCKICGSSEVIKMIFTIKTRLPGLNDYINACRHNKYKGNELKQSTDDLIGWYIRGKAEKDRQARQD